MSNLLGGVIETKIDEAGLKHYLVKAVFYVRALVILVLVSPVFVAVKFVEVLMKLGIKQRLVELVKLIKLVRSWWDGLYY